MTFEFDSDAFQREMMAQAADLVNAHAAQLTEALDRLRATRAGRPIGEIKPELVSIFEGAGGSIVDPELSEYAALIQADQHIEVKWDGKLEE